MGRSAAAARAFSGLQLPMNPITRAFPFRVATRHTFPFQAHSEDFCEEWLKPCAYTDGKKVGAANNKAWTVAITAACNCLVQGLCHSSGVIKQSPSVDHDFYASVLEGAASLGSVYEHRQLPCILILQNSCRYDLNLQDSGRVLRQDYRSLDASKSSCYSRTFLK